MAKIINKGLAKANCKMLLQSSLVAPIMVFPNSTKERRVYEEENKSNS